MMIDTVTYIMIVDIDPSTMIVNIGKTVFATRRVPAFAAAANVGGSGGGSGGSGCARRGATDPALGPRFVDSRWRRRGCQRRWWRRR
jgi:hypothetical protein